MWQSQNGGITHVGDALITQGLELIGIGAGYEIGEALRQGVAFEDMNPEQQASVAEFIGMAIEANQNGKLNMQEFSDGLNSRVPPELNSISSWILMTCCVNQRELATLEHITQSQMALRLLNWST